MNKPVSIHTAARRTRAADYPPADLPSGRRVAWVQADMLRLRAWMNARRIYLPLILRQIFYYACFL